MKHLLTALVFVLLLAACSETPTTGGNGKPVITSVSVDPEDGVAPLTVTFSVQASDPDGDSLVYKWDFDGDDQTDTETSEPSVEREFGAGNHEVGLEVSDEKGGAANTVVTVNVREPDPL